MSVTEARVSKKPVIEGRNPKAVLPSAPVVGGGAVVLGIDRKMLVALDRPRLASLWRARVGSSLSPGYWWNDELLLLHGFDQIGMWSTSTGTLVWKAKSTLLSGDVWGGHILTWPSVAEVELRDAERGQVQGTFRVGGPGFVGGDLLVTRSPELADPVRALRLDGEVLWHRELVAEIHGQTSGDARVSLFPGSIAGRFLAARGSVCFGCSLTDGAIVWRANLGLPVCTAFVDGRIVVLDWKRFVVIDEATGELKCDRTHAELQGMYHVKRGAIIGGLVVFVSESGHVAGFTVDSGELAFLEHHANVEFWGSAVADDRLLVSGSDGNLWVYEGLG
jgi:outer membrane protein assembly factor BamB